ncbi:hypothetical protein GGS21DRAFT_306796 [Xylaria nigripes]|nr:hypothetical protein GGS21DRAFT_306796 [Xylaria nigripes]
MVHSPLLSYSFLIASSTGRPQLLQLLLFRVVLETSFPSCNDAWSFVLPRTRLQLVRLPQIPAVLERLLTRLAWICPAIDQFQVVPRIVR